MLKLPRRRLLHLAAGVAAACIFSIGMLGRPGWSQTAKTIKIVNPFPPGGTADVVARVVTEQIGRTRGVTFVIENRPGGGTLIGTEAVTRAAPDGNTLLINTSAFLVGAHLRQVSFDPLTSLDPICNLTEFAAAFGRQQCFTLSHDRRFDCSGTRQAWRIDAINYRACDCPTFKH